MIVGASDAIHVLAQLVTALTALSVPEEPSEPQRTTAELLC